MYINCNYKVKNGGACFSGGSASQSSSIGMERLPQAGSIHSESKHVAACRQQQVLLCNSSCLRVFLSSSQNALDSAGAMQLEGRKCQSWPCIKTFAPSPVWLAPLSPCHSPSTVYSCSH